MEKTKVTKRAEIQERILALNFYMCKRFTRQQYLLIEVSTHLSVGRDAESEASFGGQRRASVPTDSICFQIELITSLLVSSFFRQLYLIIILNCEL